MGEQCVEMVYAPVSGSLTSHVAPAPRFLKTPATKAWNEDPTAVAFFAHPVVHKIREAKPW